MQSQAMNPLTHKFRLLMVTGIVPLENSERFEPKGIIFFASLVLFYSMPTSVVALLILLRSFIRSRVDLQLENLALPSNRCASTPAEETPENNRNGPLFWCFSVAYTARLALGISHRRAANGCGLASHGLSFVFGLGRFKVGRPVSSLKSPI